MAKELASLREENARLSALAYRDPLTGLRNRRYFTERLSEELARLRRGTESALSVITLDLNDFKRLNDTLGHMAGDLALQAVAHYLEALVREVDLCCRIGGDEFAVVLPATSAAHCAVIVERLKASQSVLASVGLGTRGLAVGASSFESGDDELRLLSRADERMYAEKKEGRTRLRALEPVEPLFAQAA